ncbi:MAG: hypothetical protein U0136_02930 [Bdellovibrionota bacterium]
MTHPDAKARWNLWDAALLLSFLSALYWTRDLAEPLAIIGLLVVTAFYFLLRNTKNFLVGGLVFISAWLAISVSSRADYFRSAKSAEEFVSSSSSWRRIICDSYSTPECPPEKQKYFDEMIAAAQRDVETMRENFIYDLSLLYGPCLLVTVVLRCVEGRSRKEK